MKTRWGWQNGLLGGLLFAVGLHLQRPLTGAVVAAMIQLAPIFFCICEARGAWAPRFFATFAALCGAAFLATFVLSQGAVRQFDLRFAVLLLLCLPFALRPRAA